MTRRKITFGRKTTKTAINKGKVKQNANKDEHMKVKTHDNIISNDIENKNQVSQNGEASGINLKKRSGNKKKVAKVFDKNDGKMTTAVMSTDDSTNTKENALKSFRNNIKEIINIILRNNLDFDEVIEKKIAEEFKELIESILKLKTKETHALLIFIDPYVEETIKLILMDRLKNAKFIDLECAKKEVLYSALEDRKHFTFFITKNAMAIEQMERRIRSRFNNVKFFFGSLSKSKTLVSNIRNLYLIEKYKVPEFNFYTFLKIFGPLHIVIILFSVKKRLHRSSLINVLREYLKKINEIKNVSDEDILDAFFDVESTGIIKKNMFDGDYYTLTEYIKKEMPLYIQRLL